MNPQSGNSVFIQRSNHPLAVVIPTYKATPDPEEQKAYRRICKVFHRRPVFICYPENMETSFYGDVFPDIRLLPMEKNFFDGIAGYNRLMLSPDFYTAFEDFRYILICQLDVWVFRDDLDFWIGKDFDYIGAPWHNRALHLVQYFAVKQGIKSLLQASRNRKLNRAVGNGGFSLRKTETFISVCRQTPAGQWTANEDYFWSFLARRTDGQKLNVPSENEAADFCIETDPAYYMKKKSGPPMAIHAWRKYNPHFWVPYIADSVI